MIDRFMRWTEVIFIADISPETVAWTFVSGWISHFGAITYITTYRDRQFEVELLKSIARNLGITKLQINLYNHKANVTVERLHRPLKDAVERHIMERWVGTLPLVLLCLWSSLKEDIGAAVSELV